MSTRLRLRRVYCISTLHEWRGKVEGAGESTEPPTNQNASISDRTPPDARVPANRKPPDKVLENRKCWDDKVAHFIATNCSWNLLCASNCSVQTVRERHTPARGGQPLHPFWVTMHFALFGVLAQLWLLPSQGQSPSGRDPTAHCAAAGFALCRLHVLGGNHPSPAAVTVSVPVF